MRLAESARTHGSDLPTVELTVGTPPGGSRASGEQPRRYVPGLNGLRALAVLLVVVYHVHGGWFPGGFLGVDVFFVISGYLITDLLQAEWARAQRLALREFWARRARRLVPALVVMVTVTVTAAALVDHRLLTGIRGDVLAAATFTSNWWQIVTHASYFADQGQQPLLRHLWSLGVEEQFYLVWPVLLAVLFRVVRSPRARVAVVLVVAGASLVAMAVLFQSGVDNSWLYLGTDTHAFGLLAGAALALALPTRRLVRGVLPGIRPDVVAVAGLVALAVVAVTLHSDQALLYRGGFAVATLAAVAMIVGVAHGSGRVGRVFEWAPLRWLGVRSYGIYLWHWPLLVILESRVVAESFAGRLVLLVVVAALAVVCAALSYRWVEDPIRRHGFRWYARQIMAGGSSYAAWAGKVVAVAAAVMLAVSTVAALSLAPADGRAAQLAAGEQAAQPQVPRPPSSVGLPGDGVTAIGDSVMLAAVPELKRRLPGMVVDAKESRQMRSAPEIIQSLKQRGELGSVVVLGLGTNGPFNSSVLDSIEEELGPQRTLLLVTVHLPKTYQDQVNQTLEAAAHPPRVSIVDWNAAITPHPELLWSDDIHARPSGAGLYTDLIVNSLPAQYR